MVAFPTSADLTGSTLTEAQFKTGLNNLLASIVGLLGNTGDPGPSLATLGVPLSSYATKTAAYTVALSDRGKLIGCSGTWTLGLPAAALAGTSFTVAVQNSGSGTITVDPYSAELIDGAATVTVLPGTSALLLCTGAGWVGLGFVPGSSRLLARSGSAALPGITFALNADTGLFSPGAGQLGLAAGGAQRALLSGSALQLDVPLTGTAVQASKTDATAGRLLTVGAFGLGGTAISIAAGTNLATAGLMSGRYTFVGSAITGGPESSSYRYLLEVSAGIDGRRQFLCWRDASSNPVAYFWVGHQATDGSGAIAWHRVISASNLLGTVSQASGLPTGAVIERGSNANGDYVRFADGTQLCTRSVSHDLSSSSFQYWTFPATFAAVPTGSVSKPGTYSTQINAWYSRCGSAWANSTSQWASRAAAGSAVADTIALQLTAIGRWF